MPSRVFLRAAFALLAVACSTGAAVCDDLKEVRLDWATYNPVSIVLKDQKLVENAFADSGVSVRWVQSRGSKKALEFLNAGSIDIGSTAGAAALVGRINGNPIKAIYTYSAPEWTALVTRKDTGIAADRSARIQGATVRRLETT